MNAAGGEVRVLTAKGAETLSASELPELLSSLSKPGTPATWIHVEPDPAVIQALDDMGLDEVAVKSLRDGPERPRVEEFADHLYISLFSADTSLATTPAPEATRTGATPFLRELRLFLGGKWLISVGDIAVAEYRELGRRVTRQVFTRGRGASFIAYHICEWLVESFEPTLEEFDSRIDALEDEIVLESGKAPMQELFSLKRDLVDLRRRIAPLRDVMQRLGTRGVLYIESGAEVYFRDIHDDVMRDIELLDTHRDILSSALDLHLSSVSNRLNQVMKQLTVVATMFLPLSFIVGFFGTNFTHIPYRSLAWLIGMLVLLFLAVGGMYIYAQRRTA